MIHTWLKFISSNRQIQFMGHVVQVLLGYHLLVNPEEDGDQGHDGGGHLLLDPTVHQVGGVTEQLLPLQTL